MCKDHQKKSSEKKGHCNKVAAVCADESQIYTHTAALLCCICSTYICTLSLLFFLGCICCFPFSTSEMRERANGPKNVLRTRSPQRFFSIDHCALKVLNVFYNAILYVYRKCLEFRKRATEAVAWWNQDDYRSMACVECHPQ